MSSVDLSVFASACQMSKRTKLSLIRAARSRPRGLHFFLGLSSSMEWQSKHRFIQRSSDEEPNSAVQHSCTIHLHYSPTQTSSLYSHAKSLIEAASPKECPRTNQQRTPLPSLKSMYQNSIKRHQRSATTGSPPILPSSMSYRAAVDQMLHAARRSASIVQTQALREGEVRVIGSRHR